MRFIVQGQSMYPYLKATDEVKLTCILRDKVRVGDVIAYFDSSSKIATVHRVVRKHRRQLCVKGDNNTAIDETRIDADRVLIVDKIYKRKRIINVMHPFNRYVINLLFVLLSISRINSLLFGRKIQYNKKISGKLVTDNVYKKYEKYLNVNKNKIEETKKH